MTIGILKALAVASALLCLHLMLLSSSAFAAVN